MTEALAKARFKQCNKLTAVTMSAAKQRVLFLFHITASSTAAAPNATVHSNG